ncbi:MAG: phosphoglucosamine mutase [Bacteroidia bacterium]|nr:phosphoglucosamine mutase [Bacteroidia bacterium]MDW8057128.1 phosphoglucosamine mutase [Bacteroidia bacterium]
MPLIVSASGIRGTVEGEVGQHLTPVEVVSWVGAWGQWLREQHGPVRVVVGQDARPSGEILRPIAVQTLRAMGHTVYDAGLTTTPTLAMAVPFYEARGGLILTASHNPAGWNALKFLDENGEFLSPEAITAINSYRHKLHFRATDHPAALERAEEALRHHIESILRHPWVDREAISQSRFRLVVDGCNSGGGIFVPALLEALGVEDMILLNCEPTGKFAHLPEPLPENLSALSEKVQAEKAHLGIAVDPDVDRVAFFLPNGQPFGEEYTLVSVADYALSLQKGPIVANLSTTMAVRQVAQAHGVPFYESRVGEYHVVQKMKAVGAILGGEGNGGVILPTLHYGRDALVGIALFLSHLAKAGGDAVALRDRYPRWAMVKGKVSLSSPPQLTLALWEKLMSHAPDAEANLEDGLKLRWSDRWVHMRASGTEPLIRIIAEAPTLAEAEALRDSWQKLLLSYL